MIMSQPQLYAQSEQQITPILDYIPIVYGTSISNTLSGINSVPEQQHLWKLKDQLDLSHIQFTNQSIELKDSSNKNKAYLNHHLNSAKIQKRSQRSSSLNQSINKNNFARKSQDHSKVSDKIQTAKKQKSHISYHQKANQKYNSKPQNHQAYKLMKEINNSYKTNYQSNIKSQDRQNILLKILQKLQNNNTNHNLWVKPNVSNDFHQKNIWTLKKSLKNEVIQSNANSVVHQIKQKTNSQIKMDIKLQQKKYEQIVQGNACKKEDIYTFSEINNGIKFFDTKHIKNPSIEADFGQQVGDNRFKDCHLCKIIGKTCSFH